MRLSLCVLLVVLVGCGAAFSDAADGGDSGPGEAAAEGSSGSSSGGSGSSSGGVDAAGDSPGTDSGGSSGGSSGSGGDGGDSGKSDGGTDAGCSTGSLSCDGQQPTTCTGAGTWQPIGNPCSGTTPACLNGACVPSVSCTPSSLLCVSTMEIASCDAAGQWVTGQCPAGCTETSVVDWAECTCITDADCPTSFPNCITAGATKWCSACSGCNGCCSPLGQCMVGTADTACGVDGMTCKNCTVDGDTCGSGASGPFCQ